VRKGKQKVKLKSKEVKAYRLKLLKKQGYICPLCGLKIEISEATLDHCHDTGHIRAVLHRNCNQVEGRIRSWVNRAGKEIDPVLFLEAVLAHWTEKYDHFPLHPNHRTAAQKEILKLKRRRKKLRTHKAKKRYDKEIRYLQEHDDGRV